jgi:hypothetical protein
MIEPTTCEGKVTFEHETGPALSVAPNEQREDLDGLELICTDASGRVTRSGTRADGFFALYLEPGTYEVKIDPAGLRPQESVTPATLTLKVTCDRIDNLSFVIRERAKRIRKTFTGQTQ